MSGAVGADIRAFFAAFERAGNTGDIGITEAQFADVFLNADPGGTNPVPRSRLVAMLPERRQLFASIGLRRTTLVAITQTDLDAHYVLVKAEWVAELENGDQFALSSTFMLRRADGGLRIVLYLNHLDIAAEIQARKVGKPTP